MKILLINIIKRHKESISNDSKSILIRDIESALEYHRRDMKIGMDSDKVIYEEFLDYLKGDSGGKNRSKLVVGTSKKESAATKSYYNMIYDLQKDKIIWK